MVDRQLADHLAWGETRRGAASVAPEVAAVHAEDNAFARQEEVCDPAAGVVVPAEEPPPVEQVAAAPDGLPGKAGAGAPVRCIPRWGDKRPTPEEKGVGRAVFWMS